MSDNFFVKFPWDHNTKAWHQTEELAKRVASHSASNHSGKSTEELIEYFLKVVKEFTFLSPDFFVDAEVSPSIAPQCRLDPRKSFAGLHSTFKAFCTASDVRTMVINVLPWMATLVLVAKAELSPQRQPLLVQHARLRHEGGAYDTHMFLTQRHVAILLVMGFFSMFPQRTNRSQSLEGKGTLEMPPFNFVQLFACAGESPASKTRCIFQYFIVMQREWEAVCSDGHVIEICRSSRSFLKVAAPPLPSDLGSDGTEEGEHDVVSSNCKAEVCCPRDGPQLPHSDAALVAAFSRCSLPLVPVTYLPNHPIEHCEKEIQSDFANMWIGGGVLRSGCVQEEIRFVVSTELLVSLLFCERMDDGEVVVINGCEQYSTYIGYGREFRFEGERRLASGLSRNDTVVVLRGPSLGSISSAPMITECGDDRQHSVSVPPPSVGVQPSAKKGGEWCKNVSVVAFDAFDFSKSVARTKAADEPVVLAKTLEQFHPRYVSRELRKVFAAVDAPSSTAMVRSREENNISVVRGAVVTALQRVPFATGNWGCGVFGGNHALKFVIQWIAASSVGRPMTFCAFGAPHQMSSVENLLELIQSSKVTVTVQRLFSAVYGYYGECRRTKQEIPFVEFIAKSIADK